MMLPMLIPQIAHVRARSFAKRRSRAALLFVLPYLLAWMIVGWLAAFVLAPVLGHRAFTPLACLFAAFWQFIPQKRPRAWQLPQPPCTVGLWTEGRQGYYVVRAYFCAQLHHLLPADDAGHAGKP